METTPETKKKWRWGFKRWIVLALIILNVLAARAYAPILPHIQLPAERVSHEPLFTLPVIGEFYWTNTLNAMVIGDVILLLLAWAVYRAVKKGDMVLSGFAGAVEAALEMIYDLTETTAGKWAKAVFPWFASITLLVLVANWMELVPGVDSIGLLEHSEHGYPIKELAPGIATIVKAGSEAAGHEGGYVIVPFVRVLSTDLNFTVGLALTAVFMVQVFGVRALGPSYFTKFFNVKGIFSRPVFGLLDFFVGLLELISEISKIISFSFRLFGNIFAGSVLLFVMGTLVPVLVQSGFLMLEFFVGLIQAVIFGMLTMVFISQAVAGHGHEEGEHA